MTGRVCPACGTPRDADGSAGPGCHCAGRAADAIRAERDAEVAAAEDFDPLRIRPYVTLQGFEGSQSFEDGEAAEPQRETAPLPAVAATPVPEPAAERALVTTDPVPQRRRRPLAWLVVGAAAVAVAGTVAFAGGLFSGGEERKRALPDTESSAPILPTPSAAPDVPSPSPSRSPSPSPSRTPSGSSSAAGPESSPPAPPPTTPPPSTTRATGTVSEPPAERQPPPATLRRGDSGPEVVELQQRLAELWLYAGPANGHYGQSVEDAVRFYQWDRGVEGDPQGVYGPNTRRALEAETSEP
ncbi:peptidoglycan-binding domain-containing protein [Streptomyces sp. NPDC000880]